MSYKFVTLASVVLMWVGIFNGNEILSHTMFLSLLLSISVSEILEAIKGQ